MNDSPGDHCPGLECVVKNRELVEALGSPLSSLTKLGEQGLYATDKFSVKCVEICLGAFPGRPIVGVLSC